MQKYIIISTAILIILSSCEEVVEIDLNSASPAFVTEAKLFKDSVVHVLLTYTTDYFSVSAPDIVEDAEIKISDGTSTEELTYIGNGNYKGSLITGREGYTYNLEINHSGKTYDSYSTMPSYTSIAATRFSISNSQSILNPEGKTVVTVTCMFADDPDENNYYMICFMNNGRMIEDRYFMLTENTANGGSFINENNMISFSESMFYDGDEVEVQLYSIDESIYNYFYQLDDILFWKRRVIPPVPYNPASNISNGALGFFAAWTIDSKKIQIRDN